MGSCDFGGTTGICYTPASTCSDGGVNDALHLKAKLALSTPEGEDRKAVVLHPARQRESFEQILSLLEHVYCDVFSQAVLRKRLFARYQGLASAVNHSRAVKAGTKPNYASGVERIHHSGERGTSQNGASNATSRGCHSHGK